jgi:hypothetical protein
VDSSLWLSNGHNTTRTTTTRRNNNKKQQQQHQHQQQQLQHCLIGRDFQDTQDDRKYSASKTLHIYDLCILCLMQECMVEPVTARTC